jgi:hypothetical protein
LISPALIFLALSTPAAMLSRIAFLAARWHISVMSAPEKLQKQTISVNIDEGKSLIEEEEEDFHRPFGGSGELFQINCILDRRLPQIRLEN